MTQVAVQWTQSRSIKVMKTQPKQTVNALYFPPEISVIAQNPLWCPALTEQALLLWKTVYLGAVWVPNRFEELTYGLDPSAQWS